MRRNTRLDNSQSRTPGDGHSCPTPQTPASDLILQSLTPDEIRAVIRRLETAIAQKEGALNPTRDLGHSKPPIEIPATIFSTALAPAESIVKFLKEEHAMSYHSIGISLERDERGIWGTYRRATRKMPARLEHAGTETAAIPLTAFSDRRKSILQTVVETLHSRGMRICEIARLLNRSYSTIYTTHLQAISKTRAKPNRLKRGASA